MPLKLVSIIIPTFNRSDLVVEAIRSAQAQTYPEKQIIVIDDGSEDDTPELIAGIEGIEYYRQENKGQAAARNLGLHYAKGEYLATLDSDDIWQENFLADSIECLEKHDLDFVFLNWTSTDGKASIIDLWEHDKKWHKFMSKRDAQWFLLEPDCVRRLFLETCPAPSSALLLRRSSVRSTWNVEMIVADDWFLILEMVLSRPCRAAFTISRYWVKRVFGDNVYDGRETLEITKKLGLHDERLMALYFKPHLKRAEKHILRKRLAIHYLNYSRLKWKIEGGSREILSGVAAAFVRAPLGTIFYIAEMYFDHIKHQFHTRKYEKKLKDK